MIYLDMIHDAAIDCFFGHSIEMEIKKINSMFKTPDIHTIEKDIKKSLTIITEKAEDK